MRTNENILRKKIMGLSVLFHIAIIVLAMTSYFTITKTNDLNLDDSYQYMEINFNNTNKSSGLASTQRNTEKTVKEKVNTRSIEKKVVKVEALEEPESEIVKAEKEINNNDKIEMNTSESKTEGEGDRGIKITGRELGNMDFDGDGEFGRKVIYFAPIKKLAQQNGRIAVNMGINRKGDVVAAAYDKNHSSITDMYLVKKALKMATQYKFEPDYTAPVIQYGRYTFIFKLNL